VYWAITVKKQEVGASGKMRDFLTVPISRYCYSGDKTDGDLLSGNRACMTELGIA
jgi:hypothetical protein